MPEEKIDQRCEAGICRNTGTHRHCGKLRCARCHLAHMKRAHGEHLLRDTAPPAVAVTAALLREDASCRPEAYCNYGNCMYKKGHEGPHSPQAYSVKLSEPTPDDYKAALMQCLKPLIEFMRTEGIASFRIPVDYQSVGGRPDLHSGYIEVQAHCFRPKPGSYRCSRVIELDCGSIYLLDE